MPYLRKGDDRLHVLCQAELVLLLLAGHCFNTLIVTPLMSAILSFILIAMVVTFIVALIVGSLHAIHKWWRSSKHSKEIEDKCLACLGKCGLWRHYMKKKAQKKSNKDRRKSWEYFFDGFHHGVPWNSNTIRLDENNKVISPTDDHQLNPKHRTYMTAKPIDAP